MCVVYFLVSSFIFCQDTFLVNMVRKKVDIIFFYCFIAHVYRVHCKTHEEKNMSSVLPLLWGFQGHYYRTTVADKLVCMWKNLSHLG